MSDKAIEGLRDRIAAAEYDMIAARLRGNDLIGMLWQDELYRLYEEIRILLDGIWISTGLYRGGLPYKRRAPE